MFRPWKLSTPNLLLLLVLSHSAIGANIEFKPAVNYPVGSTPRAVAAADFNGDGKMDVAVANFGDPSANDDGSVSILLGNGDGTYQKGTAFAAGKNPCPAYPCGMAVGDFNGDGKPDIAVPNSANAVSVLLGNGDGTFRAALQVGVGSMPISVFANDLNGDGRPDLVVANFGDQSVSVLLSHGDGTFQTPVDYPTENNASAVALADLNSDGRLDVVVAIGPKGIETFLGNGDGTLQPGVVCTCGASVGPGWQSVSADALVAVADFNGDGKLDLATAFHHYNFLKASFYDASVLIGNGDGTFQTPISTDLTSESGSPPSPAASDFDGDGHPDLTVAFPGLVYALQGRGDGTVVQPPVSFNVGSGVQAYTDAITVADLDGNKTPDVVVTNAVENTISVLLNTASTNFSIAAAAPTPGTLTGGQSVTSTISLNLLNTFDNPVSLGCSVQPAQPGSPTCSLTPSSVTFDASGKATADLTITAGTAASSLTQPSTRGDFQPWQLVWLPIAGLALAGAGFQRNRSNRGRQLGSLAVVFLLAGLIVQGGCGGGDNNSKAQTYTVTVDAKSGTAQHSTTLTLMVQ